jgi:hypothetical protein
MIYEVRTYDCKPQSVPEVEKRFAEAYETRKKFSQLAAYWHTEIGPLNQVIHVWPYKDLEERWATRMKSRETGDWPPSAAAKKAGLLAYRLAMQENKIVMPAAFSPIQ